MVATGKILEWFPLMSVGNTSLDDQHKRLLEFINRLILNLAEESDATTIRQTLQFLDKYTKEHFAAEEKYMKENRYSQFKQHKKIHEGFIKFYAKFRKEFKAAKKDELNRLGEKSKTFLGAWWVSHILNEDHRYYEFIRKNKLTPGVTASLGQDVL